MKKHNYEDEMSYEEKQQAKKEKMNSDYLFWAMLANDNFGATYFPANLIFDEEDVNKKKHA